MRFDEYSLAELLRVLWKRKWFWILTPVVFSMASWMYFKAQPVLYESGAIIRVDTAKGKIPFDPYYFDKIAMAPGVLSQVFNAYFEQNGKNFKNNVGELKMKFTPSMKVYPQGLEEDIYSVDLKYVGPDQKSARDLAQIWAEVVVQMGVDIYTSIMDAIILNQSEGIEVVKKRIGDHERDYKKFLKENGLQNLEEKVADLKNEIRERARLLIEKKEMHRIEINRLNFLQSKSAAIVGKGANANWFVKKRDLMSRAKAESLAKFIRQEGHEQKNLNARLQKLNGKLEKFKSGIFSFKNKLAAQYKMLETLYLKKEQQVIYRGLAENNVRVVGFPQFPEHPLPNRNKLKVLVFAIAGLLFGALGALFVEGFGKNRIEA